MLDVVERGEMNGHKVRPLLAQISMEYLVRAASPAVASSRSITYGPARLARPAISPGVLIARSNLRSSAVFCVRQYSGSR